MDKISREQRSKNMAAIRSRGNKTTEERFVRYLREMKITGWRRHARGAFGSPDFLFPKLKVAVFIDGCFWHGCKKHYNPPKSNQEYWEPKIKRNKKRDREVNKHYKDKGWEVIRIWEHDLKGK